LDIDLEDLSVADLKKLQSKVTRAIASYEDRQKKKALVQVEEVAKKLGYSLAELTEQIAARKRAPAAPKYMNPADNSQTWSGRGRRPQWFEAALEAGKSPNDMLIRS